MLGLMDKTKGILWGILIGTVGSGLVWGVGKLVTSKKDEKPRDELNRNAA